MYQSERDNSIKYGKHHFSDVSSFFAFLKLQDCKEKLLEIRREVFSRLFSVSDDGFSTVEKFSPEITPCRLSPITQKMHGVISQKITPEKLNAIFALAMGLQAQKAREAKSMKRKNNRFMKMRLAKK